jgi:hypothetical protein
MPLAPREAGESMQEVYRRRRRTALGLMVGLLFLLVVVTNPFGGGGDDTATAEPSELPRGGRVVLPHNRVVAFYGAPQNEELGVLGIGTPDRAARKLLKQAKAYERPGRPVLPALELIATIAHEAPGADGMHRERQRTEVIRRYLAAARKIKGILILDIQPGRADFVEEARALEPFLSQPDVGLALDPEWSVPEGVAPGAQIGSTDATTVNDVSFYLSLLVQRRNLPQKLLIVHQFTEDMVTDRARIVPRPGLAIVSNVDGFGTAELKKGVFERLTAPDALPSAPAASHIGFKLFYREDTGLMAPKQVLALRPRPDVVVYE